MARLRTVCVGEGEDGGAWIGVLSSGAWLEGAEVLKGDREVVVRRARLLGRDVVVKRWSMRRLKRRAQAVVDATPACRHWTGADYLRRGQVRTARPYALLRGRDADGACELLVMEAVPGRTLLRTIADGGLTVRQEHRLAEAVGRQLGEMGDLPLSNRDHKPSNIMVTRAPPDARGEYPPPAHVDWLAIIDCVGITGAERSHEEAFALFVECVGTGVVPRRSLRMRVLVSEAEREAEATARWIADARAGGDASAGEGIDLRARKREFVRRTWAHVAERLARHGDPTPRVDPLA